MKPALKTGRRSLALALAALCAWAPRGAAQPAGAALETMDAHAHRVVCVGFSPDGDTLLTASLDGVVNVWEIRTNKLARSFRTGRLEAAALSSDGKMIATGGTRAAKVWDTKTGELLRTLNVDGVVESVALSWDGRRLACATDVERVEIWDTKAGRLENRWPGFSPVAMTRDGHFVGCDRSDDAASLFDLRKPLDRVFIRDFEGHDDIIRAIAFSPDGLILATGSTDKTVKLWEADTGRELHELTGHGSDVLALAFSPDGSLLASGSKDKSVKLWDARTGRLKLNLMGHGGSVRAMAFSVDGRRLATGSDDKTVKLWDVTPARDRK